VFSQPFHAEFINVNIAAYLGKNGEKALLRAGSDLRSGDRWSVCFSTTGVSFISTLVFPAGISRGARNSKKPGGHSPSPGKSQMVEF